MFILLAPKPMVTKTVQKARVNFAYEPEQEDELPLNLNDIIVITNKNIFDGWMEGEINGRSGVFPDNFVTLLPPETIAVEEGLMPTRVMKPSLSVKRPGKENPAEQEKPPPPMQSPVEKKPPVMHFLINKVSWLYKLYISAAKC